ncbi:MAG: hypothetical protein K8R56_00865 [Candidatus Eisenbacteria bacterium]|nr:hypothetical protein [Candidatus Eisenbacteria bacterium]
MTRRSVETLVLALNAAGVRYLIVGGLAVVAHGHVRFTADVDLVLDPDPAAIARALEALARLGYAPRVAVELMDFARADERARWRQEKGMLVLSLHSAAHPATEVDLFLESPFDFEPVWTRGLVAELGPGLPARFVSLADLRAMKRASGRAVDQLDLDALARLHPEDPA